MSKVIKHKYFSFELTPFILNHTSMCAVDNQYSQLPDTVMYI